jgi:nicotinamide riboside transporter PnuC
MDSKQLANEKKMLTILKINEYLWLVFIVISVVLTAYMLIQGDRNQAIYFLVLTFLSGFFYAFKKRQRKRHQKRIEEGGGK